MRDAKRGALELVAVGAGRSVEATIRALKADPAVEYAEPNWIYTTQATSNDPYYTNGSLWGMYGDATAPANQYGSQAGEAWAAGHTGSATVYIGIIDEGIDFTHPDLAANIWTNPGETAGDGIDNDGNGYADDIHGWDFYRQRRLDLRRPARTTTGRTWPAPSAAVGGNGTGVAGVAWDVQLISGKFLGPGRRRSPPTRSRRSITSST